MMLIVRLHPKYELNKVWEFIERESTEECDVHGALPDDI
jgi:hypothetical protein